MKAIIGWFLLLLLRPVSISLARWHLDSLDRRTQILTAKILLGRRQNRYSGFIFGMPISAYAEPKLLDSIFGAAETQCNSTISAGTAAQTTFNLRGTIGSGNSDVTPSNNELWLFYTPGSGATQNQMSNVDVFLATGGTATTITFASRTVVAARAIGDFGFRLGTTSSFLRYLFLNTVYVGMSTAGATATIAAGSDLAALQVTPINITQTGGTFPASGNVIIVSEKGEQNIAYTGLTGSNPSVTALTGCTGGTGTIDTGDTVYLVPTSAAILAAEPTATGSYARVSVINNPANFSAASGSVPAQKVNAATITFPASSAAWSTGATALMIYFIADVSTLAGGNLLAYGYMTNPQTVNASGITPSFAASAVVQTLL